MQHKNLLEVLGFEPKENTTGVFHKKFTLNSNYSIEVDFEKEKINYGHLITVESKTIQNFSQEENWVVLECVNRLIEKGYNPQNIILEKSWAAGHGVSKRLDVCVTREDGSEFLLIECKTYGKEFSKEFARMKKDGGQLFTYFKFSNKADLIMLYASELNKKNIIYSNEIIKIEDDYRTGDVKDFYDKWNKLTKDNGVFDTWVSPYHFISKALTTKLLEDIKHEDSGFIFNRFLEILRHNVVSDKPNAFNKIFTLFLCKIYDEKVTPKNDELKFQWLEGIDDNVSFQMRLTDLYKNGMYEFLDKKVTDFSTSDFDTKYKHLDEKVKEDLLKDIIKLRLEKNNEFAIKEVFDTKSFTENAKVVKQVVELLQGFKIRYTKKQQYLSDFFELLLTTGLKQESGQFFTPVPIAQFIIKSIPIDELINEKLRKGERNNLLPYVIDYAAGSGHFITEMMHEIQRNLEKQEPANYIKDTANKIDNWKKDHFDWALQYVYGIEKDYRLVKVGKVGCYLHGDGLANVIHSDGLGNFKDTVEYKDQLDKIDTDFPKENKQFDIVVSNPPYSVPAFKQNARDYYTENDFDLYSKLTDNSSEIECLFIERTKQLLKDGGMAGIILPSSILNNTGIYTKAREIILENFDIIAITELSSNTFMATGTNTVTLFLRRRNNYFSINLKKSVEKFFTNLHDVTLNGIEKPVSKYIAHAWEGITFNDYKTLVNNKPNETVLNHELYNDYNNKIRGKSKQEIFKNIIKLEVEKLFYFIIAYPQKVVLVKSGEKTAEKQFLGYEFSNRRGSEGIHPTQRGKSIDECTQLFDTDIFENPEKASNYIYKAFKGDFDFPINPKLENNISRTNLVDMLSFDRTDFEKYINLSAKKKIRYEEVWGTSKIEFLEELTDVRKGKTITQDKAVNGNIPVIAGGKEPAYFHNKANRDGNIITISASGANSGFVNYFRTSIFASDCNTIKSKNENKISTKLIFLFLKSIQNEIYGLQRGQAQPHVYADDLTKIKIPLPPKNIQEKIVTEINILEGEIKEKI
ncbi:MAG: N-6 DNA methylase, partial [Bacteroidales bacterium]|nr:N-6 DNA methylase [Bacteroidales bacterium]